MSTKAKVVYRLPDEAYIESPDGTMRDSVMVTDETGSQQYSAGLFWVRPGTRGHADRHPGLEELYYIFEGRGKVVIDDKPHEIKTGDVVLIPDGATHYLINDGNDTLGLFWAMGTKWSSQTAIHKELNKWKKIEPGSAWGS